MSGFLAQLYFEEAQVAKEKDRSRQVLAIIADTERDLWDIYDKVDEAPKRTPAQSIDDFRKIIDMKNVLGARLQRLAELTKENPNESEIVGRMVTAFNNAASNLVHLNLLLSAENLHENNSRKKFERWFRTQFDVFKQIPTIGKEEELFLERVAPEREDGIRQQFLKVLIGGCICTFALGITAFVFFSTNIARRLNQMLDNTLFLASARPLHEMMSGTDEIATLDQHFHSMADSLEEVSRKNRAMVENARDVIFSVDEHGTFLTVNPACQSVFGYSPEDLVGSKLIRIISRMDAGEVLDALKKVIGGGDDQPFEFRIERKDGRTIDIRCSFHWVKTEKTIFCQAYDITESKQAERLRQEIMQMVSHDLKTPLSTVRSFLEMLDAGMFGEINERGHKLMKLADNSTSRMLTLIRDLLEIEKMEAGMLQLTKSDYPLQDLFDQAVGTVSSQAAEHVVRVVYEPSPVYVHVDPDRVIQILTNLLSNAIKFSPKRETVTVSSRLAGGMVEVGVQDKGRGIPAHVVDGIFDRFSQVKTTDATEKGGSGLGLAICKALVELHGGKIRVETVENQGSVFIFSLPKAGVPGGSSDSQLKMPGQDSAAQPAKPV